MMKSVALLATAALVASGCASLKTGPHIEAAPLSEQVSQKTLPSELSQVTEENVVVPTQLLRDVLKSEAKAQARCMALSAQLDALKKVDTESASSKSARETAHADIPAKHPCGDS